MTLFFLALLCQAAPPTGYTVYTNADSPHPSDIDGRILLFNHREGSWRLCDIDDGKVGVCTASVPIDDAGKPVLRPRAGQVWTGVYNTNPLMYRVYPGTITLTTPQEVTELAGLLTSLGTGLAGLLKVSGQDVFVVSPEGAVPDPNQPAEDQVRQVNPG